MGFDPLVQREGLKKNDNARHAFCRTHTPKIREHVHELADAQSVLMTVRDSRVGHSGSRKAQEIVVVADGNSLVFESVAELLFVGRP